MIAPLSPTYARARAAFLGAADNAGARVESFPHPLLGLEGEPLAVDVAEIGPRDAQDIIVVVSGTHGVEGYLGSALQRHHLEVIGASGAAPESVALVFIHALNPYGFSWVRRVNEDNVDLNRNFVDWSEPLPANPEYGNLSDALVPASWSDDDQARANAELGEALNRVGLGVFQQIVSGGQYTHDDGIFYGGTGPTWSNEWLSAFVTSRLARASRVGIIDLHTGLGPWGHGELISSARPGEATLERQREWWNEVTSIHDGSSVSAEIAGEWIGAVPGMLPAAEVTGIAIEYGTVDPILVLTSVRADAVLHGRADPSAPEAVTIRRQVRDAFIDDAPEWLEACWPRYESVVGAALAELG